MHPDIFCHFFIHEYIVQNYSKCHSLPQFGIRKTIDNLEKVGSLINVFVFAVVSQIVANMSIMTTDYKVTELFCIIDRSCKHFAAEDAGKFLLPDNSGMKRRRCLTSLSDRGNNDTAIFPFRVIPKNQILLLRLSMIY